MPEVSAAVGAAAPEAIETIRLPAGIDPDGGALDLELASTKLVGLGAAADYVVRYAYLCAEQAASRALALILRGALESPATTAPAGGHGGEEAQRALQRLEAYHCDGGYAYWKGGCDGHQSPYLTAYVLFVRQTAARHGHAIDPASLARDATDLEALLARPRTAPARLDDHAWRAFAVKVLADGGRRPDAALTALYARRDELPIFALAHLLDAQAAVDAASPRVAELRRRIRNALTVGATAHVEERTLAPYVWCWPSNTKSTAIVLDVLSRRGGASAEEAGPIVSWLLGARRHGIWSGTQENVWVLAGLAAYREAFEAGAGADADRLGRAGRHGAGAQHVEPAAADGVDAPGDDGARARSWRLARRAASRSAPPAGRPSSTRRGWACAGRRATRRRSSTASCCGASTSPSCAAWTAPPATTFRAGDLVRVTLTVRLPESRTFLAVTDRAARRLRGGGHEPRDAPRPTPRTPATRRSAGGGTASIASSATTIAWTCSRRR